MASSAINHLINKVGATRQSPNQHRAAVSWRSTALSLCVAIVLSACGGGTPVNGGTSSTYTIGGTLSGLADGQTLDLINGSETLSRSANGTFTFATAVASGGSYEVKISGAQPAWQTCSISNATGSGVSAKVTSVTVNCASADKTTGLLNDTGIDWCSENITTGTTNTWANNVVCNAVNWVGNLWGQQQDAFFGRDAQAKAGTLKKVGGGMAGIDFTKIGASGKVLLKQDGAWSDSGTEAAGTQWDCVGDNVTGLVWEVKRNNATHLRHMGHTYVWYNPDNATNGGNAGAQAYADNSIISTCKGVVNETKCNTQSYVTAVNAAGLCGKKDWRMPTVDELRNLTHTGLIQTSGSSSPAIDVNYFPDTAYLEVASVFPKYWSSSPYADDKDSAWVVFFSDGNSSNIAKNGAKNVPTDHASPSSIRLVRSGQ